MKKSKKLLALLLCLAMVFGLAACGKKPFTNTFAMFAAGRAWEQVRNSIAYPRLNVKVVGSHGGLSVGEDGATHQCIEDYAIMRAIPNMMVVSPCDGPEMRQAVRALLDYDGPAYLRLGRLAVESVTDAIPGYTFHLGQGVTLRDGSDATVIATGMMVQMALKAAESLAEEGLSVRVLDMHTIKPLDGELVLKAALETGAIVTTEEANVVGGLGSAVAEFLAAHPKVASVSYCGLPGDKYHALAEKYLPHGSCGVVSFELKGGREAAGTFMKHLKLAAIETHVADARTCCLNPASSTHRQMTDEQLAAAGIPAGLVRMSCGLESKQDLIGDIAQALDQVK